MLKLFSDDADVGDLPRRQLLRGRKVVTLPWILNGDDEQWVGG